MNDRGSAGQTLFDAFVTRMKQRSHNLGASSKTTTRTAYRLAPLPAAQFAAITDVSVQQDVAAGGNHVAFVDSRLTAMEKLVTRRSEQGTRFIALDLAAPSGCSSGRSAISNEPASTPGEHEVPFRASPRKPLPLRSCLKIPKESAAPAATTPDAATPAAARPSAPATQAPPAVLLALIPFP